MLTSTPKNAKQADVVILGAGIVGAVAALALARACGESKVVLIDRGLPQSPFEQPKSAQGLSESRAEWSPRVSALSLASVALLNELSLWCPELEERACFYRSMRVWESDGVSELVFDALELGQKKLGCIIENDRLLAVLHQALEAQANVRLLWQTDVERFEVSANSVRLTLAHQAQVLQAQILVGADGLRSRIRQLGCFNVDSKPYHHQALISHLKCTSGHGDQARQVMTPTGPVAFLPLTAPEDENHWVSLVWSGPDDEIQALSSLSDSDFLAALTPWVPGDLASVIECTQRYTYPLQCLQVDEVVQDRVVLIGDAAHVVHPLAGLGVNLGLADVACLSRVLTERFRKGLDLGEINGLRAYQRQRKPHTKAVVTVTDQLQRLYQRPMSAGLKVLSSQGLSWLNDLNILKRLLVQLATLAGPDWPYVANASDINGRSIIENRSSTRNTIKNKEPIDDEF